MPRYSKEFFRSLKDGSRLSAEQVVPLVIEIVGSVASVVDVGCGTGEWLKVFQQHGVGKILGLDGEYPEDSSVEPDNFLAADLTKPLPVDSDGFELVVSLEVAEHLPPESAEGFITELGRLGPVVLFSAAVPFQGGTHHVNEQWQSYWCALFKKQGFECFDALRPLIWQTGGSIGGTGKTSCCLCETAGSRSFQSSRAKRWRPQTWSIPKIIFRA